MADFFWWLHPLQALLVLVSCITNRHLCLTQTLICALVSFEVLFRLNQADKRFGFYSQSYDWFLSVPPLTLGSFPPYLLYSKSLSSPYIDIEVYPSVIRGALSIESGDQAIRILFIELWLFFFGGYTYFRLSSSLPPLH